MQKINPKYFVLFPLFMLGMMVAGGFIWYSPAPYWDTWYSNVDFINQVIEGNTAIWWQQYFEHRILLTKILTWLNYLVFDGVNWPLVVVNYAILFSIMAMFLKIKQDFFRKSTLSQPALFWLSCFIVAWLCQWMQQEGFMWDVESQMLLAHLLPLCALYWMHKSVVEPHQISHFYLAIILAITAVFSMGNGILALPLITVYSLLMRQTFTRIAILVVITIITPILYLHGMVQPDNHSSILGSLLHNPLGMAQYTLHYIGGPFYHLLGDTRVGRFAALVAGMVGIGLTLFKTIQALRNPKENALLWALLFFIAYVFGSALGTAGGRLVFGVDHALWSSRYSTSALLAWCAILIIYYTELLAFLKKWKINILIPFALLSSLMIFQQFKAIKPQHDRLFAMDFATFSAVMGIHDDEALSPISNSPLVVLPIAEKAYQHHFSIFATFPLHEARKELGSPIQKIDMPSCHGAIDKRELIKTDARFSLVTGWMQNQNNLAPPGLVRFVQNDVIVGYALPGAPRSDKSLINAIAFKGYVFTHAASNALIVQGLRPNCQMVINEK